MAQDAGHGDGPVAPPPVPRRAPLTREERRWVALAALVPVPVAMLVLVPFAAWGSATAGDVVGAGIVYGGLLGLAAGFVTVDRLHARQCPRCVTRSGRGDAVCEVCGYDLAERPRFVCEERHAVHLEPGVCACGRRLQRVPVVRGLGRELVLTLKIGAWLLAFLIGLGVLLQLVDRAG